MCAKRRVVHEAPHGEVRHHEAVEFLTYQIRHLAAQDDPASTQVRLQLVQRRFDFPSFVIQSGQFFSRSLDVVEDGGDQSIARFGVGQTLQPILDHPDRDGVPLALPVLHGGIETAEEGPVGQSVVWLQEKCFAHSPEQIRAG